MQFRFENFAVSAPRRVHRYEEFKLRIDCHSLARERGENGGRDEFPELLLSFSEDVVFITRRCRRKRRIIKKTTRG